MMMMAAAAVEALRSALDSLTSFLRSLASDLSVRVASAGDVAKPVGVAAAGLVAARRSALVAVTTGLALIGVVALAAWALSAASFGLRYVRRSRRRRRFNPGDPSRPWAVVTGASDGIGKGFAQELAAACFNVLLVARDKDRLAIVAREIEREFAGTMTRLLVADAGNLDQTKFLAELDAAVAALPGPLTVLVNSVAWTRARVDVPAAQDDYDLVDVVAVNDLFPTLITEHLLSTLENNRPSLILNVASYSSGPAIPYLGVECGSSKAGTDDGWVHVPGTTAT